MNNAIGLKHVTGGRKHKVPCYWVQAIPELATIEAVNRLQYAVGLNSW